MRLVCFEEKDPKGSLIDITSYQGYTLSRWLTAFDLDLDYSAEVVSVSFTTKLFFVPLFHIVPFEMKPLWEVNTWGVGVILHLLKEIHKYVKHEYVKLCKFGILLQDRFVSSPPFIYFNHLFISIRNHRYLFYTLDYNSMLLYLVVQAVPALTTGSLFSWLVSLGGYPNQGSVLFWFV